ncbi:Tyr recombinase domain-containing protein [Shewanella violacea]|uniref:Tyr recombinase domain-containing protein n=1 Tax=Shewanella violacea (strain JCM 10179 / CIP 106290 / LMG 19151 / DSS12) TaxID=637905 RepID=D4ZI09_SHEVD|nr:hypothetical protein SVI_1337 [Shewanella violacea DSS12]
MADIWNIGLNLALRISDLLSIKFSDLQQDRLIIHETKTGKLANIKLNAKAIEAIYKIKVSHPNRIDPPPITNKSQPLLITRMVGFFLWLFLLPDIHFGECFTSQ